MNPKGQTTVEFLLVFAMVAFLVFMFVKMFDDTMQAPFDNFATAIKNVVGTGQSSGQLRTAKISYK